MAIQWLRREGGRDYSLSSSGGSKTPSNGEWIRPACFKMLTTVFFSARTNEEIVAIILKGDSKAFDVDVLKAFIKLLPDNTEVSNKYLDLISPYNID